MRGGEFVFWLGLFMGGFGTFFPHLAAGPFEDAGPLRLMSIAVFVVCGLLLADEYLFGNALWRGLVDRLRPA